MPLQSNTSPVQAGSQSREMRRVRVWLYWCNGEYGTLNLEPWETLSNYFKGVPLGQWYAQEVGFMNVSV